MFSRTLLAAFALACVATFAADSNEAFWMKDGQVFMCQNGNAALLTGETTFQDGSRLMPDGTIIAPDGTRKNLTNDQALSAEGQLLQRNSTETVKSETPIAQPQNTQPREDIPTPDNTQPRTDNSAAPNQDNPRDSVKPEEKSVGGEEQPYNTDGQD